MKKASLLSTNIYLKDRDIRDLLLRKTVVSSSAVEGAGKAAARALGKTDRKPVTPATSSAAAKSA